MSQRSGDYKKQLEAKGLRPPPQRHATGGDTRISGKAPAIKTSATADAIKVGGRSSSASVAQPRTAPRLNPYDSPSFATTRDSGVDRTTQILRSRRRRLLLESTGIDFQLFAADAAYNDAVFDSNGIITFANTVTMDGCCWNGDGTALTISDSGTFDGVGELTCTTPYIPDTQTIGDAAHPMAWITTFAGECLWNDDGTKIVQGGYAGNTIASGTASTPYDLTTVTDDAIDFAVTDSGRCSNLQWGDSGNKIYVGNAGGADTLDMYNLSTPYTISAADMNGAGKSDAELDFDGVDDPGDWSTQVFEAFTFNDTGTQLLIFTATRNAYIYDVATAWDISTATYSGTKLTNFTPVGQIRGAHLQDGYLAVVCGTAERLFVWDFNTGW